MRACLLLCWTRLRCSYCYRIGTGVLSLLSRLRAGTTFPISFNVFIICFPWCSSIKRDLALQGRGIFTWVLFAFFPLLLCIHHIVMHRVYAFISLHYEIMYLYPAWNSIFVLGQARQPPIQWNLPKASVTFGFTYSRSYLLNLA